ncbi:hypothetical protein COX95_03155 [bacterium CG_4_10_14_0_2_um_filter_33_32]|nr:MAG: hypothetical protein AUJ93_01325 [bacterium CG2_30_33_46]PIR67304.1 MAG: hypothetical protein COU50_04020 [bacterium CG10_big_fil_rev_8_21_14_0_10_33_18]PIU76944.1 MAG: hypothetical protein COS74_01400 [bacterium CG06_land_8_20_14_3_00_33_50]PIW80752.1 MAG: hypothetical protein COZ97_04560 [bacterium CG_4_8_14_3_um_filter_33_28]PIY85483.1 MAG: hypothetical protein COY76_01910 [bacterium CG_4_10_14_0_8_um_filter_33_57]PIZ85734.1 MAG: hypothetical protein COX95_03155 [bacterium CG_4_10_1
MSLPTWDLVITLFFLIALAYGFILGRGRIVIILIITYLAYIVSSEVGDTVYKLLTGSVNITNNLWVQSNASLFTIKTVLFALVIILVSLKGELGSLTNMARGIRSTFLTGVYAFLNAGLIVSSVIKFLSEESQNALFAMSPLASKVSGYRMWWVVIPVIIMIAEGFLRGKEESKES